MRSFEKKFICYFGRNRSEKLTKNIIYQFELNSLMVGKMKALVTGCAGFIGSHLAERLLEEGYFVTGIDSFLDNYPEDIKKNNMKHIRSDERFEFIQKDILDINNFPEVDYVFHQAAQPGVRASWGENFESYTTNNILATQKLLEVYIDQDIERFVYASSSSVYGDSKDLPLKESSIPMPISPYGVTKLAGENLCYLYFKNHDVPVVSLRYFTVYGARQRPDMAINRFVRAIFERTEINVFGDGNQMRDFTYISDVIEANMLAIKERAVGETINIGGGSTISVNQVISLLKEITGRDAFVKYSERQKGDVLHTHADISKAFDLIKWRPKVGIEEGLKRYVEWFLEIGSNL